jgi:hypothetical protein
MASIVLLVIPFIRRLPVPQIRTVVMPQQSPAGQAPAGAGAEPTVTIGNTPGAGPVGATMPAQGGRAAMSTPSWDNSWAPRPPRQVNGFFAAIAGLVTFVALLLGLVLALDGPSLIATGFPDPQLARDLERIFGYAEWPALVQRVGWSVMVALMAVGALVALLARRGAGGTHMLRAVLASAVLVGALYMLAAGVHTPPWGSIVEQCKSNRVGPAIETFLAATERDKLIAAGVIFLVAQVLSMWPARRAEAPAAGWSGYASAGSVAPQAAAAPAAPAPAAASPSVAGPAAEASKDERSVAP